MIEFAANDVTSFELDIAVLYAMPATSMGDARKIGNAGVVAFRCLPESAFGAGSRGAQMGSFAGISVVFPARVAFDDNPMALEMTWGPVLGTFNATLRTLCMLVASKTIRILVLGGCHILLG